MKAGTSVTSSRQPREAGLKLIIAYKFIKAPIMLTLALWLTIAPGAAYQTLNTLAHDLTEGGAVWARAGGWLQAHLTHSVITHGAMLAWFDSVSTAIEGVLLLSGSAWGEWTVAVGLACLLPIELFSLEHRPSATRLLVLLANAAIVFYLIRRRFLSARSARPP
jgi:Predicted membrane protein (DUF2127)